MPPFFRPVASIRSLSELPSYPRLLKIGAAASTIFRRVCSPLVICPPIFNQMRPFGPFDCIAPAVWMLLETKRSHRRRTKLPRKDATERSHRQSKRTEGSSNDEGNKH